MNMNGLTNYDTAVFANLPVTVVIYEPVYGENGQFLDYRIVYGNPKFANDFRRIYGHDRFLDAFAIRDHLVDDVSIQMMHQYRNGKPQAFSTYISFVDSSTDGVPSGQDRREVKGGYKVALYVRVNTDMLRKKLQQDNIIVSLQNMF